MDLRSIRRRRECDQCQFRFTTYERFEPMNLTVLKRDGSTESYDRQKITRSIRLACQKRAACLRDIEFIVDRIEASCVELGKSTIPSKKIGQLVIKQLRDLDAIAYLRFASVFKEFKTIHSFTKELAKLEVKM